MNVYSGYNTLRYEEVNKTSKKILSWIEFIMNNFQEGNSVFYKENLRMERLKVTIKMLEAYIEQIEEKELEAKNKRFSFLKIECYNFFKGLIDIENDDMLAYRTFLYKENRESFGNYGSNGADMDVEAFDTFLKNVIMLWVSILFLDFSEDAFLELKKNTGLFNHLIAHNYGLYKHLNGELCYEEKEIEEKKKQLIEKFKLKFKQQKFTFFKRNAQYLLIFSAGVAIYFKKNL